MRVKSTSMVAAKADAFAALSRACEPYGYKMPPIDVTEDMAQITDATGEPVYMVKLIPYKLKGKNRFRYDIGREVVSSPLVAITKIHNRIPR